MMIAYKKILQCDSIAGFKSSLKLNYSPALAVPTEFIRFLAAS